MRKSLWVAIPFVVVSAALAQIVLIQGARGEGAARSEHGRIGHFRFEAKKVFAHNGSFEVGGHLRFESGSNTPGAAHHVVIELPAVHHFGKHENVAEFGGPGVIHIRTSAGVRSHRGRVTVRVQDNRRPTSPNTAHPDTFAIKFHTANAASSFEFAGRVNHGDIQVFQRG